jgi:hypothetical protein
MTAPATALTSGDSTFSLQVTPSPLVATIKPGTATDLTLKVRNGGIQTEYLHITPRAFSFDSQSGQVRLTDNPPADIANWITFSQPSFAVQPGQWFTQTVHIALPQNAGFSYSFALVISRTGNQKATQTGNTLKGSVAVFTLLNVDRPDATRELSVANLSTDHHVYGYLPATLNIRFKNLGNTIVQPFGNIFIQRHENDQTPMNTLPVNSTGSYILPDTSRTLTTAWDDGFPVYKTFTASDGSTTRKLTWNWADLSKLRIGRYTAKLVAVYNDGHRDVPIEAETTFWVIPWKLLLVLLVVVALLGLGIWSLARVIIATVRRGKGIVVHHRKRR